MMHRDANGIPTIRSSIPLSLFGFGLVLSVASTPFGIADELLFALRGVDELGDPLPFEWRRLVVVTNCLYMLLFVALVVTAYMFFGQRTKAPRLVIAILVASFILDAVDAAWRISFAEGDSEYVVQVMAPLAAFWPIRIVWLLYWTLSKRVKETFVYPLQASEGVAANR